MPPISVFIITLNEADRIARTIESIKAIAAEIIVVDSGSNDSTREIAQGLGARVMEQKFLGYGPQKRLAEETCANDWVLNLDADEVLTSRLIAEIQTLDFAMDGYYLRIRDALPGQAAPSRFAHTTKAVRLYRKSKGRYANSPVHDRVEFQAGAKLATLKHSVHHFSMRSTTHAIEKANRYSSMLAAQFAGKPLPRWFYLRLVTEPFTAFFKSYVLRLDMLRGWAGFVNAVVYALFRFMRLAKIREACKKRAS